MSDGMANLRTAKKELRRLVRQNLSQIPEHSIQSQSLAAHQTLLSLPEYQSAKRISIYLSMPKGELTTRSIVADALRQGKEVYVPYVYRLAAPTSEGPASVMDMVALHSQEDFEKLESDSWGIPTPSESSIASRKRCLGDGSLDDESSKEDMHKLDVIVMPGMAFDRRLARLGHGKGYYDFFLTRYQGLLKKSSGSENRLPFRVALALKEQVLPEGQEIPMGPSDWYVDALIAGDEPVLRV
ncbi:MAG: hypothetical protein Q9225_000380 [Loekoesia sp. 1 TL-2023]